MGLILIILLVVLLAGSSPNWNHSRNWGYRPVGGIGLLLIILIILLFMGTIPFGFHSTAPY